MSLIVICGPTASGKSQLAIDLAKEFDSEIVNADTMSLYRNMNIGTAKVMPDERQGIAHHMIDVLDPSEDANVAWFQREARKVIDDIIARGKRPILVGGTGLYIKAVVDEMNFPETNPEIRDRLNAEAEEIGKEAMYKRLQELDPAAAIAIDSQNLRRVIRALEVIDITGKPYTANLPQEGAMYYPDATWIGLDVPREVLDERIKIRAMKMFEDGLIEEVRDLVIDGLMSGTTARLGHGYAQIIEFQMGLNMDPIEETIIVTRQYARRQETWFKREKRINWIEAPFLPKALELLK
ncbi:MAG: tRNA (adenosine(37)-N6)-dimethylallyltransferase MiaA [Candidatus Nanopelagicaceae bacterium]|nr:tRNA (adenosine(37)-N6)-dimethylallyltransferase MiaA [Candidatus Nanopelagicaceae bacterium]